MAGAKLTVLPWSGPGWAFPRGFLKQREAPTSLSILKGVGKVGAESPAVHTLGAGPRAETAASQSRRRRPNGQRACALACGAHVPMRVPPHHVQRGGLLASRLWLLASPCPHLYTVIPFINSAWTWFPWSSDKNWNSNHHWGSDGVQWEEGEGVGGSLSCPQLQWQAQADGRLFLPSVYLNA